VPEQFDSEADPVLFNAIQQKRILRLRYLGKERIVEPHDYGVHNGVVKLLGYQIGGASRQRLPNWRWMDTGLISQLEVLEQTFPGGRSASGKHHKWDKLFIRVKPAEEDSE
jgi:hypothetical protein